MHRMLHRVCLCLFALFFSGCTLHKKAPEVLPLPLADLSLYERGQSSEVVFCRNMPSGTCKSQSPLHVRVSSRPKAAITQIDTYQVNFERGSASLQPGDCDRLHALQGRLVSLEVSTDSSGSLWVNEDVAAARISHVLACLSSGLNMAVLDERQHIRWANGFDVKHDRPFQQRFVRLVVDHVVNQGAI